MSKSKQPRRFFITRRLVLPPTPASDILIPVMSSLLAVTLGTIAYIILPPPDFSISDKNHQHTTYSYYPPEYSRFSVIAHSETSIDGHITRQSATWTFDKNSRAPYSLQQIVRDPAAFSLLIQQPLTQDDLSASFAIDRVNSELITSVAGLEQRIRFADLAGLLSFQFSEPMFGVNPFAHKKPDDIDCSTEKCLALTFDDGPSYHTGRLLDILQYSHAKATFFVLGNRVNAFADQVIRMARDGHDIGNHSWNHKNLSRFPYHVVLDDITHTTNVIQPLSGQLVRFFRPAFGITNRTSREAIAAINQHIVLWDIDPQDWRHRDASVICEHVVRHAYPGAVILLHDIYGTSVDAAQCIISRLSHEYTFVNLTTLYK